MGMQGGLGMSIHPVSTLFPPDMAAALVVASTWPRDQREQRIDHLTDELVKRGLCRPRRAQGEFLPRDRDRIAIGDAA